MTHYLELTLGVEDEGTEDEWVYIEESKWICEAEPTAECRRLCSDAGCTDWRFVERDGEWFCRHEPDDVLVPVEYGECVPLSWMENGDLDFDFIRDERPKYRAGKHEVEFVWDQIEDCYEWKYAKEETK